MNLHGLAGLHDRLSTASVYAAAALVALITTTYSIDVFARYFFNAPLFGVSSGCGYLLSIAIFLAAPQVTREGSHVAILFLQERMSPRIRMTYRTLISVVSGIACLLVAYVCGSEVWRQFSERLLTNSDIVVPQWWITVFIPYGFASAGLYFIRMAFEKDASHE